VCEGVRDSVRECAVLSQAPTVGDLMRGTRSPASGACGSELGV
jgi:hypothetical protein